MDSRLECENSSNIVVHFEALFVLQLSMDSSASLRRSKYDYRPEEGHNLLNRAGSLYQIDPSARAADGLACGSVRSALPE